MVSQLKSLCHLFHQEKEALSLRHRWRFAEDGERFLLLSHETNSTFESVKYNRVIIGSPFPLKNRTHYFKPFALFPCDV